MTTMRDALQRFLAGGQEAHHADAGDATPRIALPKEDREVPSSDDQDEAAHEEAARDETAREDDRAPVPRPALVARPLPDVPKPRVRETKEQRRIRVLEQHLADALTYIDELEERLRDLGEDP